MNWDKENEKEKEKGRHGEREKEGRGGWTECPATLFLPFPPFFSLSRPMNEPKALGLESRQRGGGGIACIRGGHKEGGGEARGQHNRQQEKSGRGGKGGDTDVRATKEDKSRGGI
jgi:hypothetical protein